MAFSFEASSMLEKLISGLMGYTENQYVPYQEGLEDVVQVDRVLSCLWEHVDIIDRYIQACEVDLSPYEIDCLLQFKHRLKGIFLILGMVGDDIIFMNLKDNTFYAVTAPTLRLENMVKNHSGVQIAATTLIPFDQHITTDGLTLAAPFDDALVIQKAKHDFLKALEEDIINHSLMFKANKKH